MSFREMLLPEFDHEMANTRKTLERVPENKLTWTPHVKSMAMGKLATHLTDIPMWTIRTLADDFLDFSSPDAPRPSPPANSRQELLEKFDRNVVAARAAIANASDELFLKPWSLLMGGQTLFTASKIATIRTWVMNHTIHHRAQLGVYLRLNDIPVPGVYGPSADESGM